MDSPSHDLRSFFRAVGSFSGTKVLNSEPLERKVSEVPAELLDDTIQKIDAPPLPVAAFVDGIQGAICVTHQEHRPVYLTYVAAGAVGKGARALGLKEDLRIVASKEDKEWVESLGTSIPLKELNAVLPPDVEREAIKLLREGRDQLELSLVSDLSVKNVGILGIDGSLLKRPFDPNLVGIIKSVNTKYLSDESCLYGLPQGFRSPRFKLPAGTSGSKFDIYSCYLRLFDATKRSWDFSLIRIEAYKPEILDELAARCLSERQSPSGGDPRWERHLASVHAVEEFLRARQPAVFGM